MNENTNPEIVDTEDVEGHHRPVSLDRQQDTEDVEGHHRPVSLDTEDDDVAGHVQPRRDLDIER